MYKFLGIIVIIGVLMTTGCSAPSAPVAQEVSEPVMDFGFAEFLGLSYEDALEGMGITEEQLSETPIKGNYERTQKIAELDNEFTEYLLFGPYNGEQNVLYGGGYWVAIEGNGEKLTKVVSGLKKMLTEKFGAPTTYPGLGNALGEITDFTGYASGTLKEEWSVKDKPNEKVILTVDFNPGEIVVVRAVYQVQIMP